MRFHGKSLLTVALLTGSPALLAQAPPFASNTHVNTHATGSHRRPSIASTGTDGILVVWDGNGQGDNDGGIFGRGFRLGTKLQSDFRVNENTAGTQTYPSAGATSNGTYLVVWNAPDGSSLGIFGQRFGGAGVLGYDARINSFTTSTQSLPAMTVLDPDRYVVVWQSENQDGSSFGIYGQRFTGSLFSKEGPEFRVNSHTTNSQARPSIVASENGTFLVVWDSFEQDGSGWGVYAQRFDGMGEKIGPEFEVNTYTTGDQLGNRVAAHRSGFLVTWTSNGQDGSGYGVFGQRFDISGSKVGPEFPINTYTTSHQNRPSAAFNQRGEFVVVWQSFGQDGEDYGVFGQRFNRSGGKVGAEFQVPKQTAGPQRTPRIIHTGERYAVVWVQESGAGSDVLWTEEFLSASALAVDARSQAETESDVNGVIEPGERVLVEPSWRNHVTNGSYYPDGTLSSLVGPAGGIYLVNDASADYALTFDSVSACLTGEPESCYAVTVGGTRPATHWDAAAREDLFLGTQLGAHLWKLHVGDSFSDVPRTQPFYRAIETIFHEGITSGCTPTHFCPTDAVHRDQMAIFVAKGIAGLGEYVPSHGILLGSPYDCSPGGVSLFTDVAATDGFCKHVHYLGVQGVTLGCAPLSYCPAEGVTRGAMASFVAKGAVAPGGGSAVPAAYSDPATHLSYSCEAASPDVHFTDVPASHLFCKHIHYLWARGMVSGCSPTQFCPDLPVTRDVMAKFLANGFGLRLNGP